jgi:hypothetical protein
MGLAGSSQREDKSVPERASRRRYEMSVLENSRSSTRTADWLKRDFAGGEDSWDGKDATPGRREKPDVIASPAMSRPVAILNGTIRR